MAAANERLPHSSVRPLNFCRNTSCTGYVSRVPDGEKQRERTSQRQCESAQLCAGLCALSGRIPATIGMWTQSPTHSRHEGSGEKKYLSGMRPRNDRALVATRTTRAEKVAVRSAASNTHTVTLRTHRSNKKRKRRKQKRRKSLWRFLKSRHKA